MKLKMVISYDGTDFAGFQMQPRQRTVQGVLETAVQELLGPGRISGASRTDAGVHARGQVVCWSGEVCVPSDRLISVLNRRLPRDLRIMQIAFVPNSFDPNSLARAKYYSYTLWRDRKPPWAGAAPYVYEYPGPLSWTHLQAAADLLRGQHDFWAFRAEGSSAKTTVRHIFLSRWTMESGGTVWRYHVGANGFLYHMVRIAVAAMLRAAATKNLSPIVEALAHPREKKVGILAPACGLVLENIAYECRPQGMEGI